MLLPRDIVGTDLSTLRERGGVLYRLKGDADRKELLRDLRSRYFELRDRYEGIVPDEQLKSLIHENYRLAPTERDALHKVMQQTYPGSSDARWDLNHDWQLVTLVERVDRKSENTRLFRHEEEFFGRSWRNQRRGKRKSDTLELFAGIGFRTEWVNVGETGRTVAPVPVPTCLLGYNKADRLWLFQQDIPQTVLKQTEPFISGRVGEQGTLFTPPSIRTVLETYASRMAQRYDRYGEITVDIPSNDQKYLI